MMHARSVRSARVLCAALTTAQLLACASDEIVPITQVMVVVNSDLAELLQQVTVDVQDEAGARTQDHRSFTLAPGKPGPGELALPFSFSLVEASENPAPRFRLVVTGWSGLGSAEEPDMVVRQTSIASFRADLTVRLTVFLGSACLRKFCGDVPDQTCCPETTDDISAGDCGEVHPQDDLAVVTPGKEQNEVTWPEPALVPPLSFDAGADAPDAAPEAGASDAAPAPDVPDGSTEEPAPLCRAESCQHGGQCGSDSTQRSCDCGGIDYQGDTCETWIDDCALTPCEHGVCSDGVRSRTCDCSGLDYEGPSCGDKIDDCARTPCAHGTCTDGLRSRTCNCKETGFSGDACTVNDDECKVANACDGTPYPCVDLKGAVAGYTCRGQLPDWPTPTSAADRFITSGDTVTDKQTGLKWQSATPLDPVMFDQGDNLCPGAGWHLPSLAELLSLVDYTKAQPASSFPGMPIGWFITALPGWAVDTATGKVVKNEGSIYGWQLCLR